MLRSVIDGIQENEMDAKIIIMSDFNDDPTSKSVKEYFVKDDLHNPMKHLIDKK
jgi:hypothetical protein